jgi:HdeA/HdeB family
MFAKALTAAIGLVLLLPSLPAAAQDTNVDEVTCGQFLASDPANARDIMLWLAGFYTYADDPPVISVDKIKAQQQKLRQLCSDNKAMSVLSAAEIVMDKMYKKPAAER